MHRLREARGDFHRGIRALLATANSFMGEGVGCLRIALVGGP